MATDPAIGPAEVRKEICRDGHDADTVRIDGMPIFLALPSDTSMIQGLLGSPEGRGAVVV